MKVLQKRAFPVFIWLFISSISAIAPAFGQNPQSIFNSTVDQINCETVRFIHREAGRAEIANNMECFSFESILKSIPEDETSTTASVAKDIENFKTRFKADDDLAAQLDKVIAYASGRIERKPRKGNVADFKQKLQDYKKDALENSAGPQTTTATPGTTPAPEQSTIDEELEEDTETTAVAATDTTPVDWLKWLSLALAIASLGLSAYLYGKLKSLANHHAIMPAATEPELNRPRSPQVNESAANYQLLESKMYQEIARLSREFDDKLAAVTASTGYTQPENFSEPRTYSQTNAPVQPIADPEEDDDFLPTPVDQADAPILTTEERTTETPEVTEIPDEPEEEEEDSEQTPQSRNEVHQLEMDEADVEPDEDEEEFEEPEELPQNTVRSDAAADITDIIPPQVIPQQPEMAEDEDDAMALPDYKYVGLPMQDGSFAPNSFVDAPDQDSLYEVEMYEDVPNKAFFSPLQYPEIIEKAISDPETYLAPCCMFLNEPDSKQNITVIEEGRLRRQGDRWYIYEKARIRFD